MVRWTAVGDAFVAVWFWRAGGQATAARPKFEAFDVATSSRCRRRRRGGYFKMDGTHRWVATNFTLKTADCGWRTT